MLPRLGQWPPAQVAAAAANAEVLLDISAAIAEAVSEEQLFAALVEGVGGAVGASSVGLWLLGEGGRCARLVRSFGYTPATEEKYALVSLLGTALPISDSLRTGDPIWLASPEALHERYPHVADAAPGLSYRIACLPLVDGRVTLGTLGLTLEPAREFAEQERDLLRVVARYAGQAIQRQRALEAERRSHAAAESAAHRLQVLGRASRAFSDSRLDLDATLRTIASELMRSLDSSVNISLLQPDGSLRLTAVQHPDARAQQLLPALIAAHPLRLGEGVTGEIALTGKSVLLARIDPALTAARAAPAYREFLQQFPAYALIGAALRVGGRVIGTVVLTRVRPGQTYNSSDLELLEELAERAAVAIENSRLYQETLRAGLRAEQLFRFAQAVVGAERVEVVFDAALTAIEKSLAAERSAVLTFDERGVMRFRAWHHLSDLYRSAVEGHSPWARDALAPEPLLVPDAQHDPAWADYHALFRAEGIGALAFIPLVSGGRLLGKFMVYYERPHEFTPQDAETALEIAYHLASVITRFTVLEQLEETVRYNELFAGVLGHDLRNPLAAMVAAAQLLLLRADDDKISGPLQRILSSGARMARMIDQLLDFTRARQGGGIALDRRSGDLWQIAKQTLEEMELVNSGWRFRVDARGDLEGDWDADRLARVFSNLSANAVQHGSPNTPVLVRLDGSDPQQVEMVFENGGVVRPDLLPTLFEPFRNTRHKRDGSQGLGLGLFITQQIVRAHGGEISVTSSEAEGTTFRIQLPRRCARAPEVSRSTVRAAGGARPAPCEQRPVVIVDDDVDVRESLAELLEGRGFPVTTAANGSDALDLLRNMPATPAVILLDLVMPVMDGYDFLVEHQLDPRLAEIPVVVITADLGVDSSRVRNAVPVLTKPVQIPQLMSTLQRLQAVAAVG